MNDGIRKFFHIMNKQKIDVDQVLDQMDYKEGKDRAYKKNFIEEV